MTTIGDAKAFTYDTLTVSAECADPSHLEWLEEFLAPSFAPHAAGPYAAGPHAAGPHAAGHADCHVELAIDASRFASTKQIGPASAGRSRDCFILDTHVVRLPAWASSRDDTVLFDADASVFYVVSADRRRVQVLSEKPRPSQRIAWMRAVRELAMAQAWTKSRAVIHGAAFVLGDRGFVIAGPKGAGKTSLLIHALQTRGAQYVANDRVVVDVAGATPAMRGMPTVVTLRPHTLDLFPGLRTAMLEDGYSELLSLQEVRERRGRLRARPAGDSVNLSPAQLCAFLQVPPRAGGRLHAVLFPRLTPERDGILVRECSTEIAVRRLLQAVFAAGSSRKISEVFALDSSGATEVNPAQLDRFCRVLAGRVRCFECEIGPRAYRDGNALTALLDGILRSIPDVSSSHA